MVQGPHRGSDKQIFKGVFLSALVCILLACKPAAAQSPAAHLIPVAFSELAGWSDDKQSEALAVFIRSCSKLAASAGAARKVWLEVCARARAVAPSDDAAGRQFFEAQFQAYRVELPDRRQGFLTGYYEPEVEGSLSPSGDYPIPLLARPADLVAPLNKEQRRGLGGDLTAARRVGDKLVAYPTRREIEQGALAGKGLELVWLRDKVTAFFVHVQGSTRVALSDGGTVRLGFAAKNGHPYSSIGKVVSELYNIAPADLTADKLRRWLGEHPELADDIMWRNESFVFFRLIEDPDSNLGPAGALGVPLTAMRSLAVDRKLYPLGVPVWIETALPLPGSQPAHPLRRLMIAQDTGSAIVGPARGDIFFGSGTRAGQRAGIVRHPGTFTILLPRALPVPDWAAKPNG